MRPITAHLLTVLILAATVRVSAALPTTRHYPLPDGGRLILSVLDGWIEEVKSPQPGAPPALWFTPRSGASFNILITPITARKPAAAIPDESAIREMVSSSAKNAEARSVEKELVIKRLIGPTCQGYFARQLYGEAFGAALVDRRSLIHGTPDDGSRFEALRQDDQRGPYNAGEVIYGLVRQAA